MRSWCSRRSMDGAGRPLLLGLWPNAHDAAISSPVQPAPHRRRSLGRRVPAVADGARTKARPSREPVDVEGYRVRHDKVDDLGKVTLRYAGRLYHLGVGRPFRRTRVILLVAGKDARILDERHRLIRALTIDPSRAFQPQPRKRAGCRRCLDTLSPMS
jgi:hypothetical protein